MSGMTTGPGTGRLSTSEAARRFGDLAEAMATRPAHVGRESVEVGQEARSKEWYVKSLVVIRLEQEGWLPWLQRMGDMVQQAAAVLPAANELADELAASVAKGKQ